MSLGTILLIVLVLILIGVIPTRGHSRAWGDGLGNCPSHPRRSSDLGLAGQALAEPYLARWRRNHFLLMSGVGVRVRVDAPLQSQAAGSRSG